MNYKVIKPCSQDWSKMNPVDGGRFCDHCHKKVHDLTEGQKFFTSDENICGRIAVMPVKHVSFKKFLFRQSIVRYFVLMFVLLFVNKVKAQLNKIQVDNLIIGKETDFDFDRLLEVTGTLHNEKTGTPVEDGFVTLYDSKGNRLHEARTDSAGRFEFVVLQKQIADSLFSLKAEYFGLETIVLNQIPVTKKKLELFVKMDERPVLYDRTTMMGTIAERTIVTTSIVNPYNSTPNKDLRTLAEILSNAPMSNPHQIQGSRKYE